METASYHNSHRLTVILREAKGINSSPHSHYRHHSTRSTPNHQWDMTHRSNYILNNHNGTNHHHHNIVGNLYSTSYHHSSLKSHAPGSGLSSRLLAVLYCSVVVSVHL